MDLRTAVFCVVGFAAIGFTVFLAITRTITRMELSDIRSKMKLRSAIDEAGSFSTQVSPSNDFKLLPVEALIRQEFEARINASQHGRIVRFVSVLFALAAFPITAQWLADIANNDQLFTQEGQETEGKPIDAGLGYLSVLTDPKSEVTLGDSFILDISLSDGLIAAYKHRGENPSAVRTITNSRCKKKYQTFSVQIKSAAFDPVSQEPLREFESLDHARSCAVDFRFVLSPKSVGEQSILVQVSDKRKNGFESIALYNRHIHVKESLSLTNNLTIAAAILALTGALGAPLLSRTSGKQPETNLKMLLGQKRRRRLTRAQPHSFRGAKTRKSL